LFFLLLVFALILFFVCSYRCFEQFIQHFNVDSLPTLSDKTAVDITYAEWSEIVPGNKKLNFLSLPLSIAFLSHRIHWQSHWHWMTHSWNVKKKIAGGMMKDLTCASSRHLYSILTHSCIFTYRHFIQKNYIMIELTCKN